MIIEFIKEIYDAAMKYGVDTDNMELTLSRRDFANLKYTADQRYITFLKMPPSMILNKNITYHGVNCKEGEA